MAIDENYKDRVKQRLAKFYSKMDKKNNPKKKKANNKPEEDVEFVCLKWMRENGFNVQIVEAKATYNKALERWVSASIKAGTCDCFGNDKDGVSVYVEFKAKGKLQTLSEIQKDFLISKIKTNCFAVCVDSKERLEELYLNWKSLLNSQERQAYLTAALPGGRRSKDWEDPDAPLFPDEE